MHSRLSKIIKRRIKRVCLRLKHDSLHVPTSTLHLHIPIVHVTNVIKRVLAIAVANGKRGNYIHGFLFTNHNNNQFEKEISCPEHKYGPHQLSCRLCH